MNLKPDVLSILIGVNDFWHTLTNNYNGTAKTFEGDLRKMLERTITSLPDMKLIIGEPFVVLGGSAINESKWIPAFRAYQKAAANIAKEFNAVWLPYQNVFDDALKQNDVSYWCPDGVHPSMAGNALMAEAWIKAFNSIYE
jgi:lysophospholipase L1-like esterase